MSAPLAMLIESDALTTDYYWRSVQY